MGRKWTVLAVTVLAAAIVFVSAYPIPAGQQGKDDGRVLTKVTFIHFRKGHAKPPNPGGGKGGGKNGTTGYYTYIASGARWRTPEPFFLNLACGENVGHSLDALIDAAFTKGMNEWETPGTAVLDIFEQLKLAETGPDGKPVGYDGGVYRGFNTLSFGPYNADNNVIAVTSVWGYFSGPPAGREITEAHILMNDAYRWGDASTDAAVMDVRNIATHELGHVAGMGDLYETVAVEETMYGYSTEGETKKWDLYNGDITGVTKLYK